MKLIEVCKAIWLEASYTENQSRGPHGGVWMQNRYHWFNDDKRYDRWANRYYIPMEAALNYAFERVPQ